MKKIWKLLKNHCKEDFSLAVYVPTLLLLIILLFINYVIDFEDSFLDTRKGFAKLICYFLFYSIPYYLVLALGKTKEKKWWQDRWFYISSAFGLFVLSLDASVPFLNAIVSLLDPRLYLWGYKVTVNLISLFLVLIPLYLFYRYVDRQSSGFYGLGERRFDLRPYLSMLIIMLPLIILATTQPSFLRQYPMYKSSHAYEYLGVPEWVTAAVYEFAYGFDFITVELLFRGFFVIGMSSILGRRSVLAMAVIYCLLHFGKPAGEAVSSIFGGYILGVIAFETRSIWGGIIVHLGIAWMMELVSFIAKQL
jgi:hypothetical protein